MEANFAQRMQISTTWIDTGNLARKPTGFLRFSGRLKEQKRLQVFVSAQFRPVRDENRHRLASFEVSRSYNNSRGTTSKSFSLHHLDLWDLSWLEFLDFYKLLQLLRLFIVRFSFSILFSSFLLFFFFLDLWHLGFVFVFF